jgi:hypothetical protein
MKKTLLIVVAAAGICALAASANADESLQSPKAKSLAAPAIKASGTTAQTEVRPVNAGSPKGLALAHELRKVPGGGVSADLAHAQRPTLSPKDPRFDAAWRANASKEFQIAPVK